MATDLLDTNPAAMAETIVDARKQCVWLPKTSELLDLYGYASRRRNDAAAAVEQQERFAEDRRIREERAANPEPADPAFDARVAALNEKLGMRQKPAVDKRIDITPRTEDCPHCGKPIPFEVRDLSALTPELLRGMADAKDRRTAELTTSREQEPA